MLTTLPQKAKPAHTALILVDVLNAFCAEGGAMHREGRDLSLVKPMMPRLHKLIQAARAAKIKLVWIQCAYNTGPNHYLSEVWLEQAKRRRKGAYVQYPVCEPGAWNGDFYQVKPRPDEVIVTKHRYCAFESTDLDLVLHFAARAMLGPEKSRQLELAPRMEKIDGMIEPGSHRGGIDDQADRSSFEEIYFLAEEDFQSQFDLWHKRG